MPHRLAGRRLGRTSNHRLHMLDNLAVSVLRYEKVIADWQAEGYPPEVLEKVLHRNAEHYFAGEAGGES